MFGYLPLFRRFTLFMTMFVKIGFVIGKLLDSCGLRAVSGLGRFGVRGRFFLASTLSGRA